MSTVGAPALLEGLIERLAARLRDALRRARRTGAPVLASASAPWPGVHDPLAIARASRRTGEPWFYLEQPARQGAALAALGCVRELAAVGEGRFGALAAAWRELSAGALCDEPAGPAGAGLVALGGFAFHPSGGGSAAWDGFPPASLIVPELALARRADQTWLTLALEVAPDDTGEDLLARAARRLRELREAPLPLLDPAPTGRHRVLSPIPPAHYEEAVARALELIAAGELEKIVLAREVEVHAPADYEAGALLGVLREAFDECFVFAVGRGEGQRAATVALAGSARRSADPAVDDHLGERLLRSDKDREENAIVARRIALTLRPHAVWVTAAPEPVLVRVANIQHLATPIRAQLARPVPALKLAGALHPTPAVGGEPRRAAAEMIPALEGIERGWYAGAVGWTDAAGDGEFCVALRCALLRGPVARLYAGCGIVRDSDPAAELAETEVKLGALLPLLAG